MQQAYEAGADIVVLGTVIEENPSTIWDFGKGKNEFISVK